MSAAPKGPVPKPADNRRTPLALEGRPPWLKARFHATPELAAMAQLVTEQKLHTVCFSAACPNLGECFARGTATFMLLGDRCTRRCGYCSVDTGRPLPASPRSGRRHGLWLCLPGRAGRRAGGRRARPDRRGSSVDIRATANDPGQREAGGL